jgi:D-3-phosphoglycerate dehydrogenase
MHYLRETLGPLMNELDIREIDLEPTGAYQEQHYRNVTEFSGSPQVMLKEIQDTEILIVGAAPVPDDVIEAGKNLKLIICPRGGPVNVDVMAATKHKIPVVNAPGRNAESVVDHTFGLLLSEVRHIARSYHALLEGNLDTEFRKWRQPLFELSEKTIGLVGFGKVGSLMVRRAKGFDMSILVYDPYVSKEIIDKSGAKKVDLVTLLRESDFVSIHARLTPETRHLISVNEFMLMKKTAIFVNTSRGPVVDEAALVEALKGKKIAGAALDVFEEEPIQKHPENPLYTLNNVTFTPHTAGQSDKIRERGARMVCEDLARFIRKETLKNVLNRKELNYPPPNFE